MAGRQSYTPAATPAEIPGTHIQRLSRPTSEHMVLSGEPWKKSPVTPLGIDPGTVRLVAQCLNHYATPGRQNNIHTIRECKNDILTTSSAHSLRFIN